MFNINIYQFNIFTAVQLTIQYSSFDPQSKSCDSPSIGNNLKVFLNLKKMVVWITLENVISL